MTVTLLASRHVCVCVCVCVCVDGGGGFFDISIPCVWLKRLHSIHIKAKTETIICHENYTLSYHCISINDSI